MAKKALLVGINAYPSAPLNGCVNDSRLMYNLLIQKLGFPPDNVRVLTDQRATTQEIKNRLSWLFSGLKAGDTAVFHYSGHGSQVRDRGPLDELQDGLDEIICPINFNWQQLLITDDQLGAYLKLVPSGARAYVVLDCCHAGTGTRELINPMSNNGPKPKNARVRYLAPPFDLKARFIGRKLAKRKIGRGTTTASTKAVSGEIICLSMNHILLAGCSEAQTSAEAWLGGQFNGALTWALASALTANISGTAVSQFQAIISKVKSRGFGQTPQLEGPQGLMSRPLFS